MKWKIFQERVAVFFEEVQRTGADIKHNIMVVKTERYHDFVNFMVNTPKIKDKYKLMIILQLSTASRISEILHLKKKDIDLEEAIVEIKILKKRLTREKNGVICEVTPKTRWGAIDPQLLPLLKEWLYSLSSDDYLFANPKTGKPFSREGVWMQYQAMMGSTTHGFRHARINYIIEEHNYSVEEVANLLQFSSLGVAYSYYNSNTKKAALRLANKEKQKVA